MASDREQREVGGPPDVPREHALLYSGGRGWSGVDAAEVVHPEDDFGLPAVPRHVLVVNLAGPSDLQEKLRGRTGRLDERGLVLLPAHAPTEWHLEREGEVRHLHLYLDPGLVGRVAEGAGLDPDRVELVQALGFHDPTVEHAAISLLAELRDEGLLGGRIYAESLASVLAVDLLRRRSSLGRASLHALERGRDRPLPPSLLRISLDYVDDNLSSDLSLARLAREVNLSPYHFARAFKASTGLTPHQYVLRRRVERAKELLSGTNLPVGMVAKRVGFASPSHFSLQFRRLCGLPPGALRRWSELDSGHVGVEPGQVRPRDREQRK